jgi:hypothetical protein
MNKSLFITLGTVAILCAGCTTEPTSFPRSWRRTVQEGDSASTASEKRQAEAFVVPDDQLELIPACKATVVRKWPCAVSLTTADGTRLGRDGPGAPPEVAAFIATLQKGQIYAFPDTFLEYQRRQAERSNIPDAGGGE